MRLTITLPELEEGASIQSGPNDRILDLSSFCGRRDPIAIVPVLDHDHRIVSTILPTVDAEYAGSTHALRITFKPVWTKVFTLCSAKKDSILALVCQFEDGQYWVDNDGWKECKLTLDGPGTDPKTVHNSQFYLGDLLSTWPRPNVVYKVMELIRVKFCVTVPTPEPLPSASPQSDLPDPQQPTHEQMAESSA